MTHKANNGIRIYAVYGVTVSKNQCNRTPPHCHTGHKGIRIASIF